MPKLDDVVKERSNKNFVKKKYRSWDLTGESPFISIEKKLENKSLNSLTIIDNPHNIALPKEQPTIVNLDNELDNKKETIKEPLDNKQISKGDHLDNTKVSYEITEREQLDITLDPTTLFHKLMKLAGIQKIILYFIVDFCTYRKSLDTGPIESTVLSSFAKASTGVIKISVKRLIDKGLIIRNKGKQAKGGYINLSITSEVYNAVIEQRKRFNSICNPTEFINSIRYQIDNNELHNSSSIYNKITTTKITNLPEEWLEVDFESLQSIGFSKNQIKQLVDKNDPSLVQESINHFAFGLEYNPKIKKYEDPLNVLMGVLRKGQGWLEKDYRSPKEIAQQRLLEFKKAEIERKKEIEEDAYKLALAEWQQTLSNSEIDDIVVGNNKGGRDFTPKPAKLSIYFKENIWPVKKLEYLITE